MGFIAGSKNKSPSTYETRPLAATPSPAALAVPVWYVDPSNSWPGGPWSASSVQGAVPGSGHASDSNSGTSPDAPLLTFAEIVRRWGTSSPTLGGPGDPIIGGQNTQIIFLSDQPDFSDPVTIEPILNQAMLSIVGTPTLMSAGNTIGVLTPRSHTAGTLDTITAPPLDFTPYVNCYAVDETIPGGAVFWILSGGPTATISAPMQPVAVGGLTNPPVASNLFLAPGFPGTFTPTINTPPGWVTIANVDSFSIFQPCKVYVTRAYTALSSDTYANQQPYTNGIVLQNLWSQSPNDPSFVGAATAFVESCFAQQCRFDGAYVEQGVFRTSAVNCNFVGEVIANTRIYGGVVQAGCGSQGLGNLFGLTLDGDVVCLSAPPAFPNPFTNLGQLILGSVYIAGQLNAGNGGPGCVTYVTDQGPPAGFGSIFYGVAAVWGPGSVNISQGASLQIVNTPGVTAGGPTGAILLTTLPSVVIDGITPGPGTPLSTYAPGTATWSSGVAPTPANVDLFNAVVNPQTGSRFCLNNAQVPFS